jgi:hypothetical protein
MWAALSAVTFEWTAVARVGDLIGYVQSLADAEVYPDGPAVRRPSMASRGSEEVGRRSARGAGWFLYHRNAVVPFNHHAEQRHPGDSEGIANLSRIYNTVCKSMLITLSRQSWISGGGEPPRWPRQRH